MGLGVGVGVVVGVGVGVGVGAGVGLGLAHLIGVLDPDFYLDLVEAPHRRWVPVGVIGLRLLRRWVHASRLEPLHPAPRPLFGHRGGR